MNDCNLTAKIDWAYLSANESKPIFPRDSTRLAALSASETTSVDSALLPAAPGKDFNFITTMFFTAWRGLHLGLCSQYSKYIMTCRRLNHFHEGLAVDRYPRGVFVPGYPRILNFPLHPHPEFTYRLYFKFHSSLFICISQLTHPEIFQLLNPSTRRTVPLMLS